MILPVDQDVGALPRQSWIDFCAVLASVLRRDPPQEPAKDRTAPLRPITLRRPSQRLNHQLLRENSRTLRNRAKFSLSVLKTRKRKEVIWTCVPQKFVRISYIPGHFLSPDSYASGHVARIQLYTCHHLEHPWLGRHFLLFRFFG